MGWGGENTLLERLAGLGDIQVSAVFSAPWEGKLLHRGTANEAERQHINYTKGGEEKKIEIKHCG